MLAINEKQKFNRIVKDALLKSSNFPRWQNAINKAVVQIELNGDFMTYDENENHLVIWSQGSDKVYSANGVCQCKAYTEHNQPCWHRAAARIVRLYFGLEEKKAEKVNIPAMPFMKQSSGKRPERVGNYSI